MDFGILKNITYEKEYMRMDPVQRRDYNPFLVNRGLSQFPDTVLQANAMNMRPFLDKQTQFDFLFHSVRKRKRFAKWPKKQNLDIIPYIQAYYECSPKEAEQYAKMLPESVKTEMRQIYGGVKR